MAARIVTIYAGPPGRLKSNVFTPRDMTMNGLLRHQARELIRDWVRLLDEATRPRGSSHHYDDDGPTEADLDRYERARDINAELGGGY